jgi:hypothetical protein
VSTPVRVTKAWAVVSLRDGRIAAWWPRDGEAQGDFQYDIFVTKKDAVRSCREWSENDCPHHIVRVEIRQVRP